MVDITGKIRAVFDYMGGNNPMIYPALVKLADDLSVGVKGKSISMIIKKTFS